jgi:hypothetical protein
LDGHGFGSVYCPPMAGTGRALPWRGKSLLSVGETLHIGVNQRSFLVSISFNLNNFMTQGLARQVHEPWRVPSRGPKGRRDQIKPLQFEEKFSDAN